MKANLSVLMLYIRRRIDRFLLLLFGLTAANLTVYFMSDRPFGDSDTVSIWAVIFTVAMVACSLILIDPSSKKSNTSLILLRLRVRDARLFVWDSVSNSLFFLLLWFGELLQFSALALYSDHGLTAEAGPQGIVVVFYKLPFLHNLMPLAETGLWVRNGVCFFCMALFLAAASLSVRHGKDGFTAAFCVPFWVFGNFNKELGEELYISTGILVVVTVGCVAWALLNAHPGKESEEEHEA